MGLFRCSISGGGGMPEFIEQVYKNGVWDDTLKTLFKTYNVTEESNYLQLVITQGSGIYINTDISANYSGIIVATTEDTKNSSRQWGICNTGATLPSIISSGSGRVTYWYNGSTALKRLIVPIISGKGCFYGSAGGSTACKIAEIYLIKSE